MERNLNDKPNDESSTGFPESKAAQSDISPPQIDFPPSQSGYPLTQNSYAVSQDGYFPSQKIPSAEPPITTQPVSKGGIPNPDWMNVPQTVPNCPPGLEYLAVIDQLTINRQPYLKDTSSVCVSKTKYSITNNRGEQVYYSEEVSSKCTRICWGSTREFEMKILDNFDHEVISMNRPMACQHCCCPCCLQSIEISAPPGTVVAVIEQKWSLFYPTFVVKNSGGDVVLHIKGPLYDPTCCCFCCGNENFKILSADGKTEVGHFYKENFGSNQKYTDENVFSVELFVNLDVTMKASMLGACCLIEMMYFESSGTRKND